MHIEGNRLGKRFGRKQALYNASFECQPGEVVALVGNNGAGKTTLLQILAGFLVPTSGTLLMDGKTVDRRDEDFRRRVAVIPDFPAAFATHSVLRHIAMVCTLHGVTDAGLEQRAMTLMEEIGILHLGRADMGALSRGELYKAVLVANLLVKPDLWLIDEPMASGMDPQGLSFLRTHLRQAANDGSTILYSTQIAEVAERFCDRVFVLKEGEILAHEPVQTLTARFGAASLEEALQKIFSTPHENLP